MKNWVLHSVLSNKKTLIHCESFAGQELTPAVPPVLVSCWYPLKPCAPCGWQAGFVNGDSTPASLPSNGCSGCPPKPIPLGHSCCSSTICCSLYRCCQRYLLFVTGFACVVTLTKQSNFVLIIAQFSHTSSKTLQSLFKISAYHYIFIHNDKSLRVDAVH